MRVKQPRTYSTHRGQARLPPGPTHHGYRVSPVSRGYWPVPTGPSTSTHRGHPVPTGRGARKRVSKNPSVHPEPPSVHPEPVEGSRRSSWFDKLTTNGFRRLARHPLRDEGIAVGLPAKSPDFDPLRRAASPEAPRRCAILKSVRIGPGLMPHTDGLTPEHSGASAHGSTRKEQPLHGTSIPGSSRRTE